MPESGFVQGVLVKTLLIQIKGSKRRRKFNIVGVSSAGGERLVVCGRFVEGRGYNVIQSSYRIRDALKVLLSPEVFQTLSMRDRKALFRAVAARQKAKKPPARKWKRANKKSSKPIYRQHPFQASLDWKMRLLPKKKSKIVRG